MHWPALKADAERAVRGFEGVAVVNSTTEVLPLSTNDDPIGIAAYLAIYRHSTLACYRLNPHPPVWIIVKNSNLTNLGRNVRPSSACAWHDTQYSAQGVKSVFMSTEEIQSVLYTFFPVE